MYKNQTFLSKVGTSTTNMMTHLCELRLNCLIEIGETGLNERLFSGSLLIPYRSGTFFGNIIQSIFSDLACFQSAKVNQK